MEITSVQAGRAIGITDQAIRMQIKAGRLPARQVGMRRTWMIRIEDLEAFAREYNYDLDLSQIQDE